MEDTPRRRRRVVPVRVIPRLSPPPSPTLEERMLEQLGDELAHFALVGEYRPYPLPSEAEIIARRKFDAEHFDEYGHPKEADEDEGKEDWL